jgi:hypothetical protein
LGELLQQLKTVGMPKRFRDRIIGVSPMQPERQADLNDRI